MAVKWKTFRNERGQITSQCGVDGNVAVSIYSLLNCITLRFVVPHYLEKTANRKVRDFGRVKHGPF
jgi:hypothetical protein